MSVVYITIGDNMTMMCSMGIEVRHSWGMTETSPVGTTCVIKVRHISCVTGGLARLAMPCDVCENSSNASLA